MAYAALAAPRVIGRIPTLVDDALKPKLAGAPEKPVGIASYFIAEPQDVIACWCR